MNSNRFYFMVLLSILALLGYLSFQIFRPFLTAIAWAVVLCVVFYPFYAFVVKFIRLKAVASLTAILAIFLIVIGPFSYISYALINEVSGFVSEMDKIPGTISAILSDERVVGIVDKIQPYTGFEGPSEEIVVENAKKYGRKIIDEISSGFTNVLSVAVNFIIMMFALFFLFKDGPGFLEKARDYLPFSEQQRDRLTLQIKDMIVSTIYGGVIVALVQGIIGGVAFAVLGINSPILWGSAMAIMSFVPLLGTSIVWLPASLILILEGAYIKGIILILIGIFVISMVDNILKPLIIGGRTKMPTVIIFFTVLGGIKFFGLLGLVMGPLVFALFLSVFEITRAMGKEINT